MITKFIESSIAKKYSEELDKLVLKHSPEDIEKTYANIFRACAIYAKSCMDEKSNKVLLVANFAKTGDTLSVVLNRIKHSEDTTVPDSYEISFTFDEVKNADKIVTITDPEFFNILEQLIKAKNERVNSKTNNYVVSFQPLEVLDECVKSFITSGTDVEIELESIFKLSVINGGDKPQVIILPGEAIKASIKSDDVVQLVEEESSK